MSQEGDPENLWRSHSWPFSNSENSGGTSDQLAKLGEKLPPPFSSSNNSPSATATAPATATDVVGQIKRSRSKGISDEGKGSGGGGESEDHEMHIWTERERRKKMRTMFSSLHALLPHLPPKADKSTIVDEAVSYIKTLQQTLQTLQKQRLEKLRTSNIIDLDPLTINSRTPLLESREAFLADHHQGSSSNNTLMALNMNGSTIPACFQTCFSPNVVLNMCGNEAQISVCSVRKTGLLATIFYILEKHKLDVVSAQISSNHYRSIYTIHVHAGGALDQFQEALPVEETFKLAVGEMILWISTCS